MFKTSWNHQVSTLARPAPSSTWDPQPYSFSDRTFPVGSYFPMCGMNLAFRTEAVPALYFLLMGSGYEYNRFGDICAGIILKKIADHLGYCVHSGSPAIKHLRASNVWSNLRQEASAMEVNEAFWTHVDRVVLRGASFGECHREIAVGLQRLPGAYWEKLSAAMQAWGELFHA